MGCRSCGRSKRVPSAIPVRTADSDKPSGQSMTQWLVPILAALKGRRITEVQFDDENGLSILLSGGIVLRVPRDDDEGMGDANVNAQLILAQTPDGEERAFFDFQAMESEDEDVLTVGELQTLVTVIGKRR